MPRQRRQSQKRSRSEQIEIVVNFLAAGKTQADAAAAAGVNTRTVQRWVIEPEVKKKLQDFRDESKASELQVQAAITAQSHREIEEIFTTTARNATPLIDQVFNTTKDILISPDSRNADKLKAAALLGRWFGLESDFNIAVACLRKYGLLLKANETGWEILSLIPESDFENSGKTVEAIE